MSIEQHIIKKYKRFTNEYLNAIRHYVKIQRFLKKKPARMPYFDFITEDMKNQAIKIYRISSASKW